MRDIEQEQISESTTRQLMERMEQLRRRAIPIGTPDQLPCYEPQDLRELQGIISELYCREEGIKSEPWVTHSVGGRIGELFPEFWSSFGARWVAQGMTAEAVARLAWHAAKASMKG